MPISSGKTIAQPPTPFIPRGSGRSTMRIPSIFCGLVIAGAAPLAGCGQSNTYVPPPPPKVAVANPLQQEITRYLEATGSTAAVNSTNLVARVQGYLQEIKYEDGAMVKQGTLLFVIEPEPYRLRLQQAKAAEEGAQATLTQTEAEFQRQQDLSARQVSSKAAFDNARAARDLAKANVDQARVNIEQAEINLGYTQVVAPFEGVVTARQVSLGELVGGGTSPTVLATIVQLNPIHVNFSISEQDVLHIRADMARRGISPADLKGKLPIEVALQTDQGYPHQGVLDYVAPTVNASTGTLAVRARLENADRKLLPGYFARVRVPVLQDETRALLVPDTALGSDQGGRYVLLVSAENVVEQRKVTTGPLAHGLRVIETGLRADDRVVVGGLMRAIPGQKVDAQQQELSAAPTSHPAK
jgi:RND family efflux transporter MFP subunit